MKNYFGITTIFVMSMMNLIMPINSSTPTMSRIRGNQYTPQVPDTQSSGPIGALVSTGVFGTNGSLSLSGQVPGSQAVATQVLPNGIIIVLFHDGTNSYMAEYTAEGQIYTGFAAGTGNILTLTDLSNPALFIAIDEQQRFIVAGQSDASNLPWIRRINSNGTVDTTFVFTDGASWGSSGQINSVGIQTSGKIVAVGYNGTQAMLARYKLNGAVDIGYFGITGHVVFNGNIALPTSPSPLTAVSIDQYNNIYVPFADAQPVISVIRLTPNGSVDFSWNSGNPLTFDYLTDAYMVLDQLRMVITIEGGIFVALPAGNPQVINVASYQIVDDTPTFRGFTTSGGVFGSNTYSLYNMLTTSDNKVYLFGSNTSVNKMAVICLTGQTVLDETFNSQDTPGVNFFWTPGGMPPVYDIVFSGAIAPDGLIFAAGAELNSGVTTPYLSCLYNNQYVYEIVQYPYSQEQGTTDLIFGNGYAETYSGVVLPYVGLYRSSLRQKAEVVTELTSGKIIVGTSGFTDAANYTSMILTRLTAAGNFDQTFGTGGKLILDNLSGDGVSEYITNIIESADATLYVTGYSSAGAIYRKYTDLGELIWNADYQYENFKAQSSGFEAAIRSLVFLSGPDGKGQINAYDQETGQLDLRFNGESDHPGSVYYNDFGLRMGPLYNGIVSIYGVIYVAYENTDTGVIDVASIAGSGTEVGIISDVFNNDAITPDNIRISFNQDGNVVVAAALDNNYYIKILNPETLEPVEDYPNPAVLSCGVSLQLRQLIGISDNTMVLVGYDDNDDDSMLVVRVSFQGVLDQTFNSQGSLPGTLSIQVGNQIPNFYARIGSGVTVQSHIGSNQGNLILSGYEQMFANDAMPVVMRIFGAPGTTQVRNFPNPIRIPGEFDPSYGTEGVAITPVNTAAPLNQEVRAIRQLPGIQIMTVITDNNTSISYTERLDANSDIDTTYGDGNGIAIAKMASNELVQTMVFDAAGNFLVTGSNETSGGFVKRILVDGSMDQSFGGSNGSPLGTSYGLMDVVNACQQLTNGNIVIVGSVDGVGAIKTINSFGQLISNFGIGGLVSVGVNATSVSVDPLNNIYVSIAYVDTDLTMKAGILKLNDLGQRVNSFGPNGNGFAPSALSIIDDNYSLRFAFDNDMRMCIAGSFGTNLGQFSVNRLTSQGLQDSTFNGGLQLDVTCPIAAYLTITSLVTLENDKILVSGYLESDNVANNYEMVACINNQGDLDGTFAGDIPGLVLFQALPETQLVRRLCNMNVQTDGNILLCGGEIPEVNYETPTTMRLYGYINVQPVPQFTGYQSGLPIVLNPSFNGNGIAETTTIADLDIFGSVATDDAGRPVVGGVTSDGYFVLARFLPNGLLDPTFGNEGIAFTTYPITGLKGGYVAVDTFNRAYIGGVTPDGYFVVARFTMHGELDTDNYGTDGIAVSNIVTNLSEGGFIALSPVGKIVITGYTTDGGFAATRFRTNGLVDTLFASTTANVAYIPVTDLLSNHGIIVDRLNIIYLGGRTSTTMVAVKIDDDGAIVTDYGNDGIAETVEITGLLEGGFITVDSNNKVFVGGLTTNKNFVVAGFTTEGQLNPAFNEDGLAFSYPVNSLNKIDGITVDSQDKIILGGVASGYQVDRSMIVARFTQLGILDTTFSSTGMATTGPITNMLTGGSVAVDSTDDIFIAGMTDDGKFVVAEMYSGYEIFIPDPSELSPQDLRVYYYGNNEDYFNAVVNIDSMGSAITNPALRIAILTSVADEMIAYAIQYKNKPGWNLIWHFHIKIGFFEQLRKAFNILYPDSTAQINKFFEFLIVRAIGMKIGSSF